MMLWLVAAYLVVSIAIGLIAATRVHNTQDYVNAGRNLPMAVVLAMVFATWFGAETVLGISATFLEEGFRGLISDPLGASACLVLFGLVFARPLYRLNLLTLGDFFRMRYNRTTELVLSICIVLSYLGWVAAQITALGLVFSLLSADAVSMNQGIMIGSAVILVYTLFGGMWSVAVTTFVQMIIIVLGLLYVTWLAGDMAGGFGPVISRAAAEGKFEFLPSLDLLDMVAWIAAFATMALGSIPQQDVFQRVNSSKSENIAVWATALGGVSYFFFAAVPLFLAYTANIIDPAMVERLMEQDSQLILPTLVLQYMPFYAQVIFFGALLSVIMSTASGTLLAPSVTFAENVLRGFIPDMKDRHFLWCTRVTITVFTALVAWYATRTDASIHHMVENAYRVTLAGAFVPLAAGLFWKRANNLGAALAIGLGLSTWILLELFVAEGDVEPQLYGLFASALGMLAGGLLGPRPAPHLQAGGRTAH
ncbi:sodium:solute symporter family protein [Thauera linaloolentis]|uniref:Na+/solute symporter n=1 Tax=Thauera linaloolentis (strain DSM 12138 / JCM 21573 / CCUG 41526 / CIP 105981 / IAM 15112 / NBRC 102519 / 47Lol) TaxID=1123367 RepID=N6YNA0_THAL4|nr:sodium:solute symporter family protein [Thauera linaloolentis]ENO83822.1 Na+/solute symporter [Thauera linaloolentis 47Lol = DSM 12138]MCM8566822.1 sodium:solute symporter family protein [Thauera linaloolentis]